jgi:hypothetical protein
MVIFTITYWYNKFFKQFLGKYSLIAFICLFLIIFLVNPKVIPGKTKYKSQTRMVYDILKDHVNSKNKLLIAPVTIFSFDKGFQSDLYFGKNAIYMVHLPIKNEYNLKCLKDLLKDMNIRYIFLGKRIQRPLLNPDFPIPRSYHGWLRNEKSPYSLERDLEIIQAYIRSKGGLVIDKNPFGMIYYLTGEEMAQTQNLIVNGSFEHWWKGFPLGEWELLSGRISRSSQSTDGSSSLRLEPFNKEASKLIWKFSEPSYKNGTKLRVRMDTKSDEPGKLIFFFAANIKGKWTSINPGVSHPGKGEWVTMSEDFTITPGMKLLVFNLRLLPGAREPAFVDNLSIELLNQK